MLKRLGWCLGVGLALGMLTPLPDASAQQCTRCSRLDSVTACVQCSVNSSKAKQMGYAESGIRRWCEENQPTCYRPKRGK